MESERRGETGEGEGCLLWRLAAGFVCWGWTAQRRQKVLSPKGRAQQKPRETEGCLHGCLACEIARKKESIRTFAA